MRLLKTNMNRYLNRFAAFRDRSFSFQLTLILLLTVIFSFAVSCFWQIAKQEKSFTQVTSQSITAGLGVLKK